MRNTCLMHRMYDAESDDNVWKENNWRSSADPRDEQPDLSRRIHHTGLEPRTMPTSDDANLEEHAQTQITKTAGTSIRYDLWSRSTQNPETETAKKRRLNKTRRRENTISWWPTELYHRITRQTIGSSIVTLIVMPMGACPRCFAAKSKCDDTHLFKRSRREMSLCVHLCFFRSIASFASIDWPDAFPPNLRSGLAWTPVALPLAHWGNLLGRENRTVLGTNWLDLNFVFFFLPMK